MRDRVETERVADRKSGKRNRDTIAHRIRIAERHGRQRGPADAQHGDVVHAIHGDGFRLAPLRFPHPRNVHQHHHHLGSF